jgi:hypothetical protein
LFIANEEEAPGWPLRAELEFVVNKRATVSGNLINKTKNTYLSYKENWIMKKVISSVLILSLMLTIFASAMPNNRNVSVKMNDTQMMVSVGGDDADCFFATVAMLGGTLGWAAATVGTLGVGTVAAGIGLFYTVSRYAYYCGDGGGGVSKDVGGSQYQFQRVN